MPIRTRGTRPAKRRHPLHRVDDREPGGDGFLGVVIGGLRVSEIGHQAVAGILRDIAVERADRRFELEAERCDELAIIFRIRFDRQRGRVDEIAEHDREHAALGRPPIAGRLRRGGGFGGGRTIRALAEPRGRVEDTAAMPDRGDADLAQVVLRQRAQHRGVDVVVPERLRVAGKAKLREPFSHVEARKRGHRSRSSLSATWGGRRSAERAPPRAAAAAVSSGRGRRVPRGRASSAALPPGRS